MFNLEQAIAKWRQQMLSGGIDSPEVLNELESHLRDDVAHEVQTGVSLETAFITSADRIGPAPVLKNEFKKIGGLRSARMRAKGAFLVLAGIPGPYQSSIMNTSYPNLEPRWATYLKAVAFLLPAACIWLFSAVFLMPKLQQICYEAGASHFAFKEIVIFLMNHNFAIAAAIVGMLLFLEWRSDKWPRYRRAVVGVGVVALNAVVLIGITMMVITALVVMPALLNHAR